MPRIRNRAKQGDTMGLTVGSLFSGIGGLDLGLEWAGFETKWFCEIEEFPQKVLKHHWPEVPIYNDVREITADTVIPVDVIAGGFPCQDISWAGIGRGIDYNLSEQEGTRSGLWWEMWRVIRNLRPRYVIAENVPALTHRGLDIVLGSLAQIGYDAEWQTISAASVGAPHIRERVFIVAYNDGRATGRLEARACGKERQGETFRSSIGDNGDEPEVVAQPSWFGGPKGQPWPVSFKIDVAHAAGEQNNAERGSCERGRDSVGWDKQTAQRNNREARNDGNSGRSKEMGDTIGEGLEGDERSWLQGKGRQAVGASDTGEPVGGTGREWVEAEYDFRGMAYGVSDRVGALKGYGNAVVPQVGYLVGRAVMAHYMEEEND
jgi:DNA (cytosine-5)-methyltransferase 1